MFCPNCGFSMGNPVKFCPNCGAAVAADPFTDSPDTEPVCAGGGAVRQGIPAPGFSDRVTHPAIVTAVNKNRRIAKIFALFFVPLPLVGMAIYSLVSGKMEPGEAIRYGGILSAVFLVFALYGFIKERAKNSYEATVIGKKTRVAYQHKNSDSTEYTEYITVVRRADGRKKKIVEREGSQIWAWDYLDVGDRFKYHPQFHFPYELYDKSKAPYLICVGCATRNPIEADCCQKCGLPLLK